MPLSLAAANGLVGHLCGVTSYVAPSGLYLALLTGTLPVQGDSMASVAAKEPAFGGSYARVLITPSTDLVAATLASTVVNSNTAVALTFPVVTTGGEVITGYAIVEAASGASGRWFVAFSLVGGPFTLVAGEAFQIAAGQTVAALTIPSSGNGPSAYGAAKLLDLLWGKTAWTMPNPPYFAIGATQGNMRTNTFNEVAYTGYGRTAMTGQMSAAALGVCTNTATGTPFILPTNSGASAAFTNYGLFEANSGGIVLTGRGLSTSPLAAGATPQIASGTFSLGLA
jgi:hypothetical protein